MAMHVHDQVIRYFQPQLAPPEVYDETRLVVGAREWVRKQRKLNLDADQPAF
jgi:hypothetical protein